MRDKDITEKDTRRKKILEKEIYGAKQCVLVLKHNNIIIPKDILVST